MSVYCIHDMLLSYCPDCEILRQVVLEKKDEYDELNLIHQTHSPSGILLCAIEDLRSI